MQDIALVSVDMFQTLVDVDSRCHPFWQQVLGESYSRERAVTYWSQLKAYLRREYRDLFARDYRFIKARTVAERAFGRMFLELELGLELDPAHAADIFVKEHGYADPFSDTGEFLHQVGRLYPICLVSDADEEMIGPLRHLYPFDHIFTSERAGSYKSSPDGALFRNVVEHYSLAPKQIVHIGDSPFDVLGAGQAGIITCWLNRLNKAWRYDYRPHQVVQSLQEASALLAGR